MKDSLLTYARKFDVHYANYIIDTLIPYRCATKPLFIQCRRVTKEAIISIRNQLQLTAIYLVDLLQLGVFVTIVLYVIYMVIKQNYLTNCTFNVFVL